VVFFIALISVFLRFFSQWLCLATPSVGNEDRRKIKITVIGIMTVIFELCNEMKINILYKISIKINVS